MLSTHSRCLSPTSCAIHEELACDGAVNVDFLRNRSRCETGVQRVIVETRAKRARGCSCCAVHKCILCVEPMDAKCEIGFDGVSLCSAELGMNNLSDASVA